ncbi:MAG: HPr family phosphocarrier protein [Ruminococcaceae bacterium]|nr:HPr family phosphocarrier protein [Oscillospiraceae bacterium]
MNEYKHINNEPSLETTKIMVLLNKITHVVKFVRLVSKCRDDVVVKSGNFSINAKSLLALFCLDLSKPVFVEFHGDIPQEIEGDIKKFIV